MLIIILFLLWKTQKLYVPAVTLSAKENLNLPEPLRTGSERSVYWNEYKTKKWRQ